MTTEPLIDYGDSFEVNMGLIGQDPRWPKELTVQLFRRDDRGQRLIVEERRYARIDDEPTRK